MTTAAIATAKTKLTFHLAHARLRHERPRRIVDAHQRGASVHFLQSVENRVLTLPGTGNGNNSNISNDNKDRDEACGSVVGGQVQLLGRFLRSLGHHVVVPMGVQ